MDPYSYKGLDSTKIILQNTPYNILLEKKLRSDVIYERFVSANFYFITLPIIILKTFIFESGTLYSTN